MQPSLDGKVRCQIRSLLSLIAWQGAAEEADSFAAFKGEGRSLKG